MMSQGAKIPKGPKNSQIQQFGINNEYISFLFFDL